MVETREREHCNRRFPRRAGGAAIAIAVALVLLPSVTQAAGPSVPTRKEPIVETIHGVAVADPYRWLEDAAAPEVQRWTEQQNALTRKALDAFPGRKALTARFWQLYEIGSLGTPVAKSLGGARRSAGPRRYFYARRDGKQNQPV